MKEILDELDHILIKEILAKNNNCHFYLISDEILKIHFLIGEFVNLTNHCRRASPAIAFKLSVISDMPKLKGISQYPPSDWTVTFDAEFLYNYEFNSIIN